jgi:hypothetical protein
MLHTSSVYKVCRAKNLHEAASTDFYWITRHYIPEHRNIHVKMCLAPLAMSVMYLTADGHEHWYSQITEMKKQERKICGGI